MRRIGGVLGGMGPIATVDFMAKVIALTPANCDQQHVPLVVYQVPQIPDRSLAIMEGGDAPFPPMLLGLQRLAAAGAEFVVIPCISAHYWYKRLATSQTLPILHVADAVAIELELRAMRSLRLAILATRGTCRSGIFDGQFGDRAALDVPDEATQRLIDQAIDAVKAGQRELAADFAGDAAQQLLDSGADALVLACTELPVALEGNPVMDACVDSTLALARFCVAESCRENPSPDGASLTP